ncbi:MAG: hypothetical protein SFU25_11710 [Candidatus Caenarcaniphilales bacterium]|nr:hypothetical protein [Candidatus Caenarcaniphilales bacterium]
MQTKVVTNVIALKQGAIFCISDDLRTNLLKFYPEISLDLIDYGIVLSQSCDLVKRNSESIELSHMTIAYLEPLAKYIENIVDGDKLTTKLKAFNDSVYVLVNN